MISHEITTSIWRKKMIKKVKHMESWHAIIIKVLYEYFQIAYKKKNTSIASMKKPMWTFCKKRGKK